MLSLRKSVELRHILTLTSLAIISHLSYISCETQWEVTNSFANGQYVVTRNINLENNSISFHVVAATRGFVALGLSPNGGMTGADMFIGGVKDNGVAYFSDYYASGPAPPVEDTINNWILISAKENDTHTEISFSRTSFDTCDSQDVEITEDTMSLIWSFGDTDEIKYHGINNRGTLRDNFLDPPMPSADVSQFDKWPITVEDTMPSVDTSYMCSIHKAPNYEKMHHIVGFEALLQSEEALNHTHHFNLWKCEVPEDKEDEFEAQAGEPAFDCTSFEPHPLYLYCQKHLYVWAKGGHRTMFPDHVGLNLVEQAGKQEYYMLEIHYDNPSEFENRKFTTGLTVYHTENLRDNTAGVLVIGHHVSFRHTIPPMSTNFLTVGHCTKECTQDSIPQEGINVFNVLLHSHLSGRKLKLRHFRDGKELPWFAVDNNYDFNFQQNRPLTTEQKILRGDHLTYECTSDTTWKKDKSVTVGYLSTSDEMCETFLIYYPKMPMDYCASSYPKENLLQDFGFENFTGLDTNGNRNNPIITGPVDIAGRNYADLLTNEINWTPELRKTFQERVVNSDHEWFCAVSRNAGLEVKGMTRYPDVPVYEKEDTCKNGSSNTDIKKSIVLLVILAACSFLLPN